MSCQHEDGQWERRISLWDSRLDVIHVLLRSCHLPLRHRSQLTRGSLEVLSAMASFVKYGADGQVFVDREAVRRAEAGNLHLGS